MKAISVTITYEEVLELLTKQIKDSPLKTPLKEFLEAHLSEDYKITQLYKVLTGVSLETKVKLGESFWVKYHSLPSWKFDKQKMREENMLVEDKILCRVTEINKYLEEPIKVGYMYIDDQGAKKQEEYFLRETYLTDKNEEFPF